MTLANYVTTAALVFVAVVFVVGGFMAVTGSWSRTFAAMSDLWHLIEEATPPPGSRGPCRKRYQRPQAQA